MSPINFLLEFIIIRAFPWYEEDSSPTSWNPSTKFITDLHTLHYLVVTGSKKQEESRWYFFKFHKRRDFFSVLKNLSAVWVNLTLHAFLLLPRNAFLSPLVWPRKGHSLERRAFWFALVPYTHRQNRNKMIEA